MTDAEYDTALRELLAADALPLAQIDEAEERGMQALRTLIRVSGVDWVDTVRARASMFTYLRSRVRFMNEWVRISTGAWVGSVICTAVLAATETGGAKDATICVAMCGFMAVVRWDRRRQMRKPVYERRR